MEEVSATPFVRWSASADACARLVAIPYAGAGAALFRDWAPRLPSTVDLWAVRLPGRESRFLEPPITSIGEIVSELLRHYPADGVPLVLFGQCSGALIAFELAQQLGRDRDHGPVKKLIVAAQEAPNHAPVGQGWSKMPKQEFLSRVRAFGGPLASGQDELLALLEPALRADFEAVETYKAAPREPLHHPVTALWGTADPWVRPEGVAGWNEETRSTFRMACVPGGHLLAEEPELLISTVAEEIESALAQNGDSDRP